MSVEASKWAWEQRGVSATAKLVLLAIADHSDERGLNAYPSINRLAEKTGLAVRTVCRAVRDLEIAKKLKIEKSKTPFGDFDHNVYQIPVLRGVLTQSQYGGTDFDGQGVLTQWHTNHPKKPSEEKNKKAQAPLLETLPDWIPKPEWEEFKDHRKRKRALMTERTRNRIIAVLSKLKELGHDPARVLTEAVDRNWVGIKVEWFNKSSNAEVPDTREEARARHEWMQRVANGEQSAKVREELRASGRWK